MKIALCAIVMLVLAAACSSGDDNPTATPTSGPSACATADAAAATTCWTQLAPLGSGGFPPEPGSHDQPKWAPGKFPLTLFPVIGFNGDLWMTSQTHSYSSPDGLTWTQHDKADWGERIASSFAFFDNKLWMFGGLDYKSKKTLNDIWSSSDGVAWSKSGDAAWPARDGASVVAFQDRLWLFGGTAAIDDKFNPVQTLNDVWSSDDGVNWTQVTAATAWPGRDAPTVTVFDDALYLVGGQGKADIWKSTDGANWTQLTEDAPWKGRNGYGVAVFGGAIWVYGGFIGESTNCLNDVWFSKGGATWTQQTEHAPWAPRLPRSIVFRDKLWIFSGKHTGAKDNWGGDLWVMDASPP